MRRAPATSQAGLAFLLALAAFACEANHSPETPHVHAPASSETPTEPSDAPFVVMSFNIRFGTADDGPNRWELRRDHVVNVIRKYAPDIIGVQEALDFQLDALLAALPRYDAFGVGRDDGQRAGEHAAILFDRDRFERIDGGTFWFSETPDVVCSTSWGNKICRICTWAQFRVRSSGKHFFHYNVHLDHQSADSRLRSAMLLVDMIERRSPAGPVIVTGDFNAAEASPPIEALARARISFIDDAGRRTQTRLIDTYRAIQADDRNDGTFGGWTGNTTGPRIDYLFVIEDAFDVVGADIARDKFGDAWPSDHYPIWARLRFHASPVNSTGPD